MKRLIINADDFGYDEGVVQGIIDLHQAGLVTSASCMSSTVLIKWLWPKIKFIGSGFSILTVLSSML